MDVISNALIHMLLRAVLHCILEAIRSALLNRKAPKNSAELSDSIRIKNAIDRSKPWNILSFCHSVKSELWMRALPTFTDIVAVIKPPVTWEKFDLPGRQILSCDRAKFGCVPFGESKNGFLILDLPNFAVERNVKSEIGFVTLVTFRQRVQYARQPLKKWRVFYCLTNYAIVPCRI